MFKSLMGKLLDAVSAVIAILIVILALPFIAVFYGISIGFILATLVVLVPILKCFETFKKKGERK